MKIIIGLIVCGALWLIIDIAQAVSDFVDKTKGSD